MVGGGVRDLLLGGTPKDFDIATDATPEQVKSLFRNSMLIGRRFRIVHVRYGREIIEVTTFRAHHGASKRGNEARKNDSGMLTRDNVYGNIKSDALRRDFTVNALYFDPTRNEMLDFTSGVEDTNDRILRIIGDPAERYREDPVRMLRAVRFAAKLGFDIEEHTLAPIAELAPSLEQVAPARLFDEVLKLLCNGSAVATLQLLQEHKLFPHLFPGTAHCLEHCSEQEVRLVEQATINTDKRIRTGKRVTPAFIYAVFLWLPLRAEARKLMADSSINEFQAMQQAAHGVIGQQLAATSIPKRFLMPMKEIWNLQYRLDRRNNGRALVLMEHQRFRAAYDFLLLRESSGEDMGGLGHWWTLFQDRDEAQRETMISDLDGEDDSKPKKRRRPRRRKPKKPSDES